MTVAPAMAACTPVGASGREQPPTSTRTSFEGPLSPPGPTACTRMKKLPAEAIAVRVVMLPRLPSKTLLAPEAVPARSR